MSVHQRVGYVRRPRQDFFAGHALVFVIFVSFAVSEDSASADDPRLGLLRERLVSEMQVGPVGVRSVLRHLDAIEDGARGRLCHVGLVGVPMEFSRPETTNCFAIGVAHIRDLRDLGTTLGRPIGADDDVGCAETAAEGDQFLFRERLATEHQHSLIGPRVIECAHLPVVEARPDVEALDFKGEVVVQGG